ncbi:hypothetical protein ALT_8456 [Aspergillus lentulus]|uniref:Uncharacterized protein n=1 Tax=Aspergillus lentulus TaxID=293939 RepID=A0AAN5YWV7_ASPLE|nr:hypothetical protein CNMCM6069_005116 [Aspergillus lentulus]KAF4190385.1 hypothetical protein CNMCM7927_003355 [Aspergillus lentulus]KAF4209385.1 hypothetical protein CNMCM8927_006825 [Aspergillus lentulus]GAQ11135.1 hypothetical protein ALT_8456 [Aspergillus lentulus]GFF52654.1 hypothetical protein IFM62136_02111 [Aspergillus lentulus]
MSVRKLDRKSGQVYEEQAMAPGLSYSMGPSWVHESPFCTVERDARQEKGTLPLKECAMEQFLSDQRNLTPELFRHIPWRMASRLWDHLGKRQRRTLYMWKLFATVYPAEFQGVAKYRSMKVKWPQMPLREYWSVVKSDTLSWRLVLTLTPSFGRVPELVEIANIKNLVALEITTPLQVMPMLDSSEPHIAGLNDRITRTWSELAETSGAFTHLRILRLYRQPDLTPVGIRYLSALPGLCLIIAHGCPNLKSFLQGEGLDKDRWEVTTIPQFVVKESMQLEGSEPPTLYECYQTSFRAGSEGHAVEEGILDRDSPVLDFRIVPEGSPGLGKRGSSSSTIYFQRRKASGSRPPEPPLKKVKMGGQSPEKTPRPRSGSRKPVMRERNPRDLRDVLGDFL